MMTNNLAKTDFTRPMKGKDDATGQADQYPLDDELIWLELPLVSWLGQRRSFVLRVSTR